jgi:general secretion pathway protein B
VIFAVVYMGKDKVGSSSQADNDQQVASIINEPPVVPIPTPSETAQAQQSEPQPAAAEEPTPQAKPQPQQPKVIFSKEPLDMSSDVADEVQSGASQSGDPKLTGAESSTNQELKEENIQAVMISELPDSIRQSIPSIEFAGHVYSSTVERRSVMLNGRKMREGDAVSADLFLHAITPDGAEFDYQGYRFKLNALQDWSSR